MIIIKFAFLIKYSKITYFYVDVLFIGRRLCSSPHVNNPERLKNETRHLGTKEKPDMKVYLNVDKELRIDKHI